jgi:hypothetical protein
LADGDKHLLHAFFMRTIKDMKPERGRKKVQGWRGKAVKGKFVSPDGCDPNCLARSTSVLDDERLNGRSPHHSQ